MMCPYAYAARGHKLAYRKRREVELSCPVSILFLPKCRVPILASALFSWLCIPNSGKPEDDGVKMWLSEGGWEVCMWPDNTWDLEWFFFLMLRQTRPHYHYCVLFISWLWIGMDCLVCVAMLCSSIRISTSYWHAMLWLDYSNQKSH